MKTKDAYIQMTNDRFALRHAWEMIHGRDDDRGDSDNLYINRADICDETPDIDWEFEKLLDQLEDTGERILRYSKTKIMARLLGL